MHGHKPVGKFTMQLEVVYKLSQSMTPLIGLNKHFHMACIQWRLERLHSISLTTDQIWDHLHTLYDLKTLVGPTANTTITPSSSPFLRITLKSFPSQMRRGSSIFLTVFWGNRAHWNQSHTFLSPPPPPPPPPLSLAHSTPREKDFRHIILRIFHSLCVKRL